MNDAIALLQQLGFSEYEARAYTGLLQRSPLNGYELAKLSGVPRANIYAVLAKLEERGAVMRVETPVGMRYAPVAPAALTQRLGARMQESLARAQQSLESVAAAVDHHYVWNTRGYESLLEHARALIAAADAWLLIAIRPQEAFELADVLFQTEARGVAITTLCLAACPHPCGGCRGDLYRYDVMPGESSGWLVLVPDGAEVLAGEILPQGEALTVRTRQRLLVELAGAYIRHSIALAALVDDLAGRRADAIGPTTLKVLESISTTGLQGDWLARMYRLIEASAAGTAAHDSGTPSRHADRP